MIHKYTVQREHRVLRLERPTKKCLAGKQSLFVERIARNTQTQRVGKMEFYWLHLPVHVLTTKL